MFVGLRERKKAETRRRIAEAAHRLFGERGFQAVTVVEVARAAEVAEATLFNYFPTKEDLFYSGLEAFGARLVDGGARPARRRVRAGRRSARAARRRRAARPDRRGRRGGARPGPHHRAGHLASPALQARERQVLLGIAAELADAIGPVAGDDAVPRPRVANALMGVHIALVEYTRARLLADDHPEALAADVQRRREARFALLEHGLAAFARTPG